MTTYTSTTGNDTGVIYTLTIDTSGNTTDSSGNTLDASGNILDASGNAIDPSGNTIAATGNTAKVSNYNQPTLLNNITIPKTITVNGIIYTVNRIDNNAFKDALNLQVCTFPTDSEITSFGGGSFKNCGITSISFPPKVSTIETEAFRNSSSLQVCTFTGTTPVSISDKVFWGCFLSDCRLPVDSTYTNFEDISPFGNQIGNKVVRLTYVCFNKGTTILCLNSELKDEYVPVERLKVGDLVKSYKHGYRRIAVMLSYHMRNDPTRFGKSLYRMNKNETMTSDLIITGMHSIMVDDLGDYEPENTKRLGSVKMIDGKYLLLSALSRDFTMLDDKDDHSVYHFCLDGDGDEDARYGVYANGVLCETPSRAMLNKYS
jgi:hypothetical protein